MPQADLLGGTLRGYPLCFFELAAYCPGSVLKKKKNKSYYKVLDVKPDAGPGEIKKAYRKAAKKYHPDVSAKNGETFKRVQEAYETLSDPEKKRTYDRELKSGDVSPPGPQEAVFRPDFQAGFPSSFSFGLFDVIDSYFSEIDDLWFGTPSDSFGRERHGARQHHVEIILTPDEAAEGTEIPLEIPLWNTCSQCGGTGRTGALICGRCRGEGEERSGERYILKIPPRIRGGVRIRLPLDLRGIKTELAVTIRIQG